VDLLDIWLNITKYPSMTTSDKTECLVG